MVCRWLPILLIASACVAPVDLDESNSELSGATTIVALTFDDTFSDNFQVGSILSARDMRGVFYVNSSRFGASGYMTRDQLLTLQRHGHEIAGHTISHANLTQISEADGRAQVCNDRYALMEAGFAVTSFAYPFGANNATAEQIVDDCGYNSGRDVGGLRDGNACVGCPYANALPLTAPFRVRTNDSVTTSTTLARMQDYVIQAERAGGGLVPIVFHHVCDGCNELAVSPAVLAQFADWLAARGPATQVGTMQEAIGGPMEPAIRATSTTAVTTNLLQNPSLEIDANVNQIPDCWQRGGYGTNAATYALVNDAFDGSVAQRITMTSWSSGGRRLVTAQDAGTCAPRVTAGRTYRVTASYKSNVQPIFSIYYRKTNGTWAWFAQSPRLPASTAYRQATYTTPALPADATMISVGLTIIDVGTLTMDAFSLVDTAPTPNPSDTAAPNIAISCNGAACSTTTYPAPVNLVLTATDMGGIREVRYTTDGSDPTNGALYTGPLKLTASATVRVTATDYAGNRANQSATVTVQEGTDNTPPALTIACNGAACSTAPYTGPVTVALDATDAGGVREIRYTTNGSDPTNGTLYTGPFTVSASATINTTAVDNAGNRSNASAAITVQEAPTDTTPPALAIACNGGACSSTYSAPVQVSVTASDASGIREVRYSLDGSDPSTGTLYTAPFTVSTSATVRAVAVDNANNRTEQTVAITIQEAPANLLQNASLELDADRNGIPDCWKRGGYGTNTATYTLVADAFDGTVAQRVDITSFSSGGRRLASAQDAGACAPAATPGRRYTVTARYKSNIAPRVSIYVRGTNGAWRWFAESAALPAASSYALATYTTPAMPSDATAISVGVSIFGVGSLTTDAYTLVAAP